MTSKTVAYFGTYNTNYKINKIENASRIASESKECHNINYTNITCTD